MTNELEMIVGAKNIAAVLGLKPKRIYEMADSGALPCVKLGGSVAIRRKRLAEWLDALETAGSA